MNSQELHDYADWLDARTKAYEDAIAHETACHEWWRRDIAAAHAAAYRQAAARLRARVLDAEWIEQPGVQL